MKPDFTIAGTKLPFIPKNTEYKTSKRPDYNPSYSSEYDKESLESYGMFDDEWLKCDIPNSFKDNFLLFKLSTIERLAKEQGMYEDEKFKLIVRMPCGHDVELSAKEFIDVYDCKECKNQEPLYISKGDKRSKSFFNFPDRITHFKGIGTDCNTTDHSTDALAYLLKSKQMKPTITLQKDGSVQIANTTTLDAETVNTIFELKKAESEKPKEEFRKLNTWYGNKKFPNWAWRHDEDKWYRIEPNVKYHFYYASKSDRRLDEGDYELAPQEVQQRLTDYAVNVLGMKEGSYVDRSKLNLDRILSDVKVLDGKTGGIYYEKDNQLELHGRVVFKDGIWASIIQPTKITASELLRDHNLIVVG